MTLAAGLRGLAGECGYQILDVGRAVITDAVDEKSRRAVDAVAGAAEKILADARSVSAGPDFIHPSLHIQAQCPGVARQVLVVECLLVLIQQVVHFPKAALGAGGFGRFGSAFRMGMRIDEGKIPEDKTQTLAQAFLDGLNHRIRLPTIRAFVIAILDQLKGGIGRALNVIPARYRQG